MSKILSASLFVAAAVTAMLAGPVSRQTFAAPSGQDQKVLVKVKAPADIITSSEPFDVDITIDNAANLFGFQFDLTFDRKLLRSPKATESPFLGSTGRTVNCLDQKEGTPENQVRFVCFTLAANREDKNKPGPSGSAVIATVQFEPTGKGSSMLELGGVKVLDVLGTSLDVQAENGSVAVDVKDSGTNWLLWGGVGAAVIAAIAVAGLLVARRRRSVQ